MADLVSEIISQDALNQLDQANKKLEDSITYVEMLAEEAKKVQLDFKGIKDFSALNDQMSKANASMSAMTVGLEGLKTANDENAKAALALAKATELESKAQLNAAKASTENAKQKEIESRYTIALTKEKERLQQAVEKEQAKVKELGNDYEILKKAYIEQANKAKNLGVTMGVTSEAFKNAAAEAQKMHQALLKVETAVGQSQRNVGNYAGSLMSVSQVLREAPAFANSFQTGLMAIGNNLPILGDEFKKLSGEVGRLRAAGIMLGSVFSASNLFVLAFTGFQFLQKYLSKTTEATDKYAKSLDNLDKQANKTFTGEVTHVKVLVGVAQDHNIAMATRLKAVKELQDTYPEQLGNLSKETMLTGDLTKATNDLNQALMNRALMRAADKKAGEAADRKLKLELELEEAKKGVVEAEQKRDISAKLAPMTKGEKEDAALRGGLAMANDAMVSKAKNNVKEVQAQLNAATADVQKFVDMAKGYAGKGGFFDDGKDKTKKGKDHQFQADSEYAKSVYELEKQRLEIDAANQKEIADNQENGIKTRLDAYAKYQQDMIDLAGLEADKEIDIATAKYNELERQKKDASAKQLEFIKKEQLAQMNFIDAAVAKQLNAENDIYIKGRKDFNGIIKSSNTQWIADKQQAFETIKTDELNHYLYEEKALKAGLDAKELTRKEYDKRMLELQNKMHIAWLTAEVNFDKEILKNGNLTADEELKYKTKLANDTKALVEATGKGAATTTKPKVGRVTDSIAKSLVPFGGMEQDAQEKYLQEFYDRTVQLANQATDAIITAQNRQFDNQMKMLELEKTALERNAQLKEDAINATTINQIDKTNQIAKLHAQTAAQEQEIESKKRRIEIERAKFEKAAAIAGIIQSTAVAIASALKYNVAAPPIIALIAAAGAAQLASAASAPIPQYRHGTTNHTGGAFIAGDGGEAELISAPGKSAYWSNSISTLYNEPAGTTVTPLSKLMKYANGNIAASFGFAAPDSTGAIVDMKQAITSKLDEQTQTLAMVARANRTVVDGNKDIVHELRKQRKLQ